MLGLVVLFILLSPGFLLTIPAIGGRYFRTNKTSPTAVIIHGIIFGLLVYLVRKYYSKTFFEGFAASNITSTITDGEAIITVMIKSADIYIAKIKAQLSNNSLKLPTDVRNKLKANSDKINTLRGNFKQLGDRLAKDKTTLQTRIKELSNLSASAPARTRTDKTNAVKRSEIAANATVDLIKSKSDNLKEEINKYMNMSIPTSISSSSMNIQLITSMRSSSMAMPQPNSSSMPLEIPSKLINKESMKFTEKFRSVGAF